jgi:hypothetical protein
MTVRPIVLAALCAMLPVGSASAWLLQPPVEVPELQKEIDTFQEASASMLQAFANLNAILAEAERNHAPVSTEALAGIRAEIQRAIKLYEEAAAGNLAELPLSIEALSEVSSLLAFSLSREGVPMATNAADLANALAEIAGEIDQTLATLIEIGGITPEDPVNIQAREGIAMLAYEMNFFVQVGNAGAAAIGVTMNLK